MAAEWTTTIVGDLAGSISETHSFAKEQLIFLNTSDILQGNVLHRNYSAVKNFPGQAKKSIRKGDILFSEIRPANGRYAYIDFEADDYVVSTKLMVIRASNQVLPKYLYHFLTSKQITDWLQHLAEARSGTFPQITFDQVATLELNLPPKVAQAAIVEFVDALDDKIELNRKMNQTLEAMVRAIFKSWFVDFDPVHAKAEDRDTGLHPDLAALFPDSFEDSELGEIPKGWGTSSVYDLATYINGAAYRAFEPNEERRGLPIIKIAELKAGVTSQTRFSAIDMPSKYKIDTGDILFSWSGNPDTSIDIFVWPHGPAWLNQHIFRVVPHSVHERAFILMTLRSLLPVFAEIARNKQTTGLGHVTVEDLTRLVMVRPPESVLMGWNMLVEPMLDRSFGLEKEIKNLVALRDALLPKLVSGEIRVENNERISTDGNKQYIGEIN
jgi:type I restriction enzyme S subunit